MAGKESTRLSRISFPQFDSEPRIRAAVFHYRKRQSRRDHALGEASLHPSWSFSRRARPASVGPIAGGTIALAAACALAASAVLAAPLEPVPVSALATAEPIEVRAALDAGIGRPDPAAAIEALAPTTPTYRALRQALQSSRSGTPDGDKAATNRLRQIEVNLERQRWLPRRLPAERVWVNAADARLVLYRGDRSGFSTRVIIGQDGKPNQTPEFRAAIDAVLFNPPWNIPESIATEEIVPKISHDPNYL